MRSIPDDIRVLHVDDDADFAELTAEILSRNDRRIHVEIATSVDDAIDRLRSTAFDCVVSDYDMPERDGIDFLQIVREDHPTLPFILFTGKGSEEIASEAISAGVSDYLQKGVGTDRYALLANRVGNLAAQYRTEATLETQVLQQQRVAELGRLALGGTESEALFDRATEYVADTLGNEYAKVLEYRPDHDDFLLRSGVGWREGLAGHATVGAGDDSQAGYTLRAAEPIIVDDLRTEERFSGPALLWDHGVVSGISVIIGPRDDPWGVLGTHTTSPTVFTEDDVTFVENVANVLANAIERAEREGELERERERFTSLFDTFPEPTLATAFVGEEPVIRDVNAAFEDVFGIAKEDAIGESLNELLVPEEALAEAIEIDAQVRAGEVVDREVRRRTTEGLRYFNIRTIPIELSTDPFTFVFYIDISERKRIEMELQAERDLLADIMSTTPVGITVVEADGTLSFVNDRAEEIYGRPWDEIAEFTHDDPRWDLVDDEGDPFDPGETPFERVMTGMEPIQSQVVGIRHPSGERRWLSVNGAPNLDDEGELVQAVFAFQDITEQRELETRLAEVYERITDGFYALDEEFRFTHVNERSEELLQAPEDELLGNSVWEMYPEAADLDVIWNAFHTALEEQIPQSFDIYYDPLDFFVEGTVYPSESGISVFFRDVTEERIYERQLERQNERLEEFTSVVSHDLLSPLNVAQGRVELARAECDSVHLDSLAQALGRMDALIHDLLKLAREGKELGDVETVEMPDLVDRCWRNVSHAGASLSVEGDWSVRADPSRLQQLLENLLRNAVENGGPEVVITIGRLDTGFYVEDDGPGIPERERDQVFEAGYSTSPDGTGFGLSIVKQIAAAHGWSVRITDGSHGGARFEITGVEFGG